MCLVLAGTAYVTVPLPAPVSPEVIESQSGWFELAVHAQPACVVTATAPMFASELNV